MKFVTITKTKPKRKEKSKTESEVSSGGGGRGAKGRWRAGKKRVVAQVKGPPWEYRPGAFTVQESADYYKRLTELVHTCSGGQQATVKIYGKECKEKRLKAYFSADSKSYRYSGKESKSHGWPSLIQELVDKCHAMIPGAKFVRALVNWYRDGTETVGKHRDKDGLKGCIASLSFYPSDSTSIERDFVVTRDEDNALVLKQPLAQGSLFLMHEQMQKEYQHELPPRKTIRAGRINVTLREAQE